MRASHNFISKILVNVLELEVCQTKALGIQLGDGHKAIVQGRCPSVEVEMDALTIANDPFVFDLGDTDVILGIAWLETLLDVYETAGTGFCRVL